MELEDDELNLGQENEPTIEPEQPTQEPKEEPTETIEPEEEINFSPVEDPDREYTTGFNHAYVLASAEPVLLDDIVKSMNPLNPYYEGFFAGKEQYQHEQVKVKEEELSQLRNRGRDRSNELER